MTSPYALEYDVDTVLQFVQQRVVGLAPGGELTAIGLRRRGSLVAGVIYEGFNQHNMWMHVAAIPGRTWLNRMYLKACFAYPFNVAGVRRVSGYVDDSSVDARRFNEHLGFREEARLRGAASNGGDVILYVMWREDCRYV